MLPITKIESCQKKECRLSYYCLSNYNKNKNEILEYLFCIKHMFDLTYLNTIHFPQDIYQYILILYLNSYRKMIKECSSDLDDSDYFLTHCMFKNCHGWFYISTYIFDPYNSFWLKQNGGECYKCFTTVCNNCTMDWEISGPHPTRSKFTDYHNTYDTCKECILKEIKNK